VPELFGPMWIQAFKKQINASAEYRRASNNWELPVVLVSRADPEAGQPTTAYVYLDLWHGACREARNGTVLDVERAPVVISANRAVWVDFLKGKIELLSAILLRKISIDKGNVTQLLGSVAAVRALAKAAAAASEGFS
jgi:putative sterol carrier protein